MEEIGHSQKPCKLTGFTQKTLNISQETPNKCPILSYKHSVLTAEAYGSIELKLEGWCSSYGFRVSFNCLLGKMLLNHDKLH
jgi:hypothetical protein